MNRDDLAAKISSMIFDAAVKASTAEYVVDGANAVDAIAAEARKLVGGLEAEVSRLQKKSDALNALLAKNLIELSQKDDRIAGLEAALVEERAKAEFMATKYHKDYEYFSHVWDRMVGESADLNAASIEKARAVIGAASAYLEAIGGDDARP